MRLPTIQGVIRRRLLVNFRVAPEVITRLLPASFSPKLHGGYAIAGICLIRLEEMRPPGLPRLFGVSSENAAHRIAVQWEDAGAHREGVYVPRRDTDSRLNALVGGRLFPGELHFAGFQVEDKDDAVSLEMKSADAGVTVRVRGRLAETLPDTSCFSTLAEASSFFEPGSLGYSATRKTGLLQGVSLRINQWRVAPFHVEEVFSSYFGDPSLFPPGSVGFDHALVMRDIAHEWRGVEDIHVQTRTE